MRITLQCDINKMWTSVGCSDTNDTVKTQLKNNAQMQLKGKSK